MFELWEKHKAKTCQHMYIKGKNVNTQCTVKAKGEGSYCGKHRKD
jgi:hypothetical protein